MDVVICTYNNANLLDQALASLEAQEVNPGMAWSVLVVDNNCTDPTPDVVDRYIGRNRIPGLRRVRETRQGLAHARRRAIAETGDPILGFLDDDCLVTSTWVARTEAFFADHPEAGAVGSRVQLIWETPPDETILRYAQRYALHDHGDRPCRRTDRGPVWPPGAGLAVRRAALHASGWIDHGILVGRCGRQVTSGEDTELVCRIRHAGFEVWYNPAMELRHYIPRGRISVEYLCRLMRGNGQIEPVLELLAANVPATAGVRLRQLARSTRRMAGILLATLGRDWLQLHRMSADHRVEFACRSGRLRGALDLLLHGYPGAR